MGVKDASCYVCIVWPVCLIFTGIAFVTDTTHRLFSWSPNLLRPLSYECQKEAEHLDKQLRDARSEVAERDSALAKSAQQCDELQEPHTS